MSDVFTNRRPMIDLDEFERLLRAPRSADRKDADPLAELLRNIVDKDDPQNTDFEPNTQLSAMTGQDTGESNPQPDGSMLLAAGPSAAIESGLLRTQPPQAETLPDAERSTVETKRPIAQAPLIAGDFAAIEAGLLGVLQEQAPAAASTPPVPHAVPGLELASDERLILDNEPASLHDDSRSRRPLYAMLALVIAGMAGIVASIGLNRPVSAPEEIALIKADNVPAGYQADTTSRAEVSAPAAPILSKPPEPTPPALDSGAEPAFAPQAEKKTPPAESHAQFENAPAAAPEPPAQPPAPVEALNTPAPSEPDTGKTELAPTNGALPNGTPPQANINQANINEPPLPAPQSAAAAPQSAAAAPQSAPAAKAPAAKPPARVAKPVKPATARHSGGHGQPRQLANKDLANKDLANKDLANKDKAAPVSPPAAEPAAAVAAPTAETPAAPPSQATDGPLAVVQNAVNSLTNTTAKLFHLGPN